MYKFIPWSKKHKLVTKAADGGLTFNLSNSFAQPVTLAELMELTNKRGDISLIKSYNNHSLEYTPNGGSKDLRNEIASTCYETLCGDNVLVFPGAQLALQTVNQALAGIDAGDIGSHAITFTPGYQSVVSGPLLVGIHVTTICLNASNCWQIDCDEVEKAIRQNTKYIVLNLPHNPTGTLISQKTQDDLIALARRFGLYIICDEVYRLLEHDESHRLPAFADAYDLGISIVTLSKPWGACGVTIGWAATRNTALMEKISDCQYFGCVAPSRASEIQAMMVLGSSDWILARNLEIIRRNKTQLTKFMDANNDLFEWVPPTAGAIAAIRFKGLLTSAELGAQLAEQGISIKPAYCFSETEDVSEATDYFRVGFGEDVMPMALEAFSEFVAARRDGWLRDVAIHQQQ